MPIFKKKIPALGLAALAILTVAWGLPAAGYAQPAEEDLTAKWTFDAGSGATATEVKTGTETEIMSPYRQPTRVAGPSGSALRLDGYTTYLQHYLPQEVETPSRALTTSAWVALEAYPVTNAPIVNRYTFPDAGYFFGMDKLGRWYLAVSIDGEWYTCWAEDRFPKDEWVHVAGTFDSQTGEMAVYLNGEVAGTATVPATPFTEDQAHPMMVGRNVSSPSIGPFETGLLNGLLDEVAVYHEALAQTQIRDMVQAGAPPSEPALGVPEDYFAGDEHRPAYHPIPPSDWTNEPHGLVRHDGAYHLFYQKNPNGPYWEQIHWGHLRSENLTEWNEQPIALAPDPGWDNRGIWSGDAVVKNDLLTLIYTGVGGGKAGIGVAQEGGNERRFDKRAANPVIPAAPSGTDDFRDPYLWQEGGTWHMIVGSGFTGEGGTALHYTAPNLTDWTYQGPFFSGQRSRSGRFWEMPILVPLEGDKYVFSVTTVEDPEENSTGSSEARALYWIGEVSGGTFQPDHEAPKPLDLVNQFLSPTVSWKGRDQPVAVGIVPDDRPPQEQLEAGWAHTFSLPRVWRLCGAQQEQLCQAPAPELDTLRGPHASREDLTITPNESGHLNGTSGRQLEIQAELASGDADVVGMDVYKAPDYQETTRIYYDATDETINLDTRLSNQSRDGELKSAPLSLNDGEPLNLRVYVDHSVLTVFVNGREAFSARVYPSMEASTRVDLFAEGGEATAQRIEVWRMAGDNRPLRLPVEMSSFDVQQEDRDAVFTWRTLTETNNRGFEIQQRSAETDDWEKVGFKASEASGGTSTEAISYRFRLEDLKYGRHTFRLVQVDRDGARTPSSVERTVEIGPSGRYALSSVYPNPLPRTQAGTVKVAVQKAQKITVRLYDALGQRVRTLHDGALAPNETKRLRIEPGDLSSGVYFVRVEGDDFSASRKVVLVR